MVLFDLLLVGIEVSVAFAGFAGVIATFQFRDTTKINRGDVVGLTMIVTFGLMCALFCALPMFLSTFDVEGRALWVICSSLGAIYVCRAMYYVHTKMKTALLSGRTRVIFGILQSVAALIVFSLILNVADLVFHREPGPYLAAIFFPLCVVGYMFIRLLLRPIWRTVREQEASNLGEG